MHASNTLPSRNDATGSSRAVWQPPHCERTHLAGYDTSLLPGVSYQAANQSSCHNGADVASGGGGCLRYQRGIFLGVASDGPRLLAGETYGGSGVGHVPPSRAGSLRQIFTNNNRHSLAGSDNEEAEALPWRGPHSGGGSSKWRHRFTICLALVERHRSLSPAFHLTFHCAIYPEFASRLEVVAALLLRFGRYSTRHKGAMVWV